jgi:hypothetical protein
MSLVRVIFFILLGASLARAESSGKFVLEGQGFLKGPQEPVAGSEARIEAEYNQLFSLSESFQIRFHPAMRSTSTAGSMESSVLVDPRELFGEFRGNESAYFQAGFFTPTWEGTDGLNPMDIAAVRDNSDPLKPNTLASAGVRTGVTVWGTEFEFFGIPRQTRSRLPGERSPWWPRRMTLPLRTETTELQLPDNVEYERLSRQEISGALNNNFGMRLQWHGDAWDLALGGFEGAAETPIVVPTLNATLITLTPKQILLLQSPVQLTPVDYRRRTGSGFATLTLGEWIFRLAGRHDQPMGTDIRLPGWSQQAVFGFERGVEIAGDQVIFLLQTSWGRRQDDGSLLSISDLFDRAILGGVRWPVGESWTFFFSGFRSQKDGSWFAQAEVGKRWADSFSSEVFMQMLDGPPESLLGILGDRDRAGARLIYSY